MDKQYEDSWLEHLLRLSEILTNLESVYLRERDVSELGPGYSSTSYPAEYTFTSASYEEEGLSVSIRQDPDEDVMYGELSAPGLGEIKVAAMCEDEDTGAVVSRLFWQAWLRLRTGEIA